MGVFKRGNNWYCRVFYNGEKIVRTLGPDYKEAVSAQKKLEAEIAQAKAADQPWTGLSKIQKAKKQPTFAEVAKLYVDSRKHQLKPSSLRSYMDILDSCLLKEFGGLKVSQITEEKIRSLQDNLCNGRSAARVNNIMILLRSIMKDCFRRGLIAENPCLLVPCLREEAADIDPLTLDELALALNNIDPFFRPLFTTLAWTGMRPGEARALQWTNIDWRRGQIKIAKSRARGIEITAEGKQNKYIESAPKTKSSVRVIPMHPEVRTALEEIKSRPLNNMGGYVFLSKKGQPLDVSLDAIWAKALRKANLKHRHSYQLRHTWASMALEAGESPAWVSNMLGHETMATTFRHYARFIPNKQNGNLVGNLNTPSMTSDLTQKLIQLA